MMTPSIWTDDFFDDFMRDFPFYDDKDMHKLEKKLYGRRGKNIMRTDIKETDNEYTLIMDLPGFAKEDVQVSLDNGYLTISAQKGMSKEDKEKKAGKYIRRERYAGACQRTFYVGENVRKEDIGAKFRHGVLKLTIPKKEIIENKTISIE